MNLRRWLGAVFVIFAARQAGPFATGQAPRAYPRIISSHDHIKAACCFGETSMQTFLDALSLAKEKIVTASQHATRTPG
jgi:hypothetical protein